MFSNKIIQCFTKVLGGEDNVIFIHVYPKKTVGLTCPNIDSHAQKVATKMYNNYAHSKELIHKIISFIHEV